MAEDMPDGTPESMSEDIMPDRAPIRMSEDTPDIMPEDKQDRMLETSRNYAK